MGRRLFNAPELHFYASLTAVLCHTANIYIMEPLMHAYWFELISPFFLRRH